MATSMATSPCNADLDLALSVYLEKQLRGLEHPIPEMQQEFQEAQHRMRLELKEHLPVTFIDLAPYLDARNDGALDSYFALLDELIFNGILSQWVCVKWSQSIGVPARVTKFEHTGWILVELRAPNTTSEIHFGRAAMNMLSALLGAMCLAWIQVFRCRCIPCESRRLAVPVRTQDVVLLGNTGVDPSSIRETRSGWKSRRLGALAARVASHSLGIDFYLPPGGHETTPSYVG
ncbi:MAG: hypothetical protein Q9168_001809 [Polycauliona sp. 1 TL-2023]